jgi:hypothetical protein
MEFSRIRPSTIALVLAAGFMLLVGTYTENGGFQLAGILLAVVAGVVALSQARSSGDSDKGGSG